MVNEAKRVFNVFFVTMIKQFIDNAIYEYKTEFDITTEITENSYVMLCYFMFGYRCTLHCEDTKITSITYILPEQLLT